MSGRVASLSLVFSALQAAALAACVADPFTEHRAAREDPGFLGMFVYVPEDIGPAPPLVVALHGCAQSHTFATDVGLVDDADARGAIVVAAEQRVVNNGNLCFNWFNADDARRDAGEAASIAEITRIAVDEHAVDRARIYVVGVSAGAAMANSMLAEYPDLFAGGLVLAGGPHGCASHVGEAAACMRGAVDKSAAQWGALVPDDDGRSPRVVIGHGDDDVTVDPRASDALVSQWKNVHGLDDDDGEVHTAESDAGAVRDTTFGGGAVRALRFEGLGHEAPIDPRHGCGRGAPFLAEVGLCVVSLALDHLDGARDD